MPDQAHLGKRKERDSSAPTTAQAEPFSAASAAAGNRLLAGYLAHEFLTAGTLLGERWDPARPNSDKGPAAEPGRVKEARAYAEVARLLKAEGAHIPGVVNPTQLGRWLQM